MLKRFIFPDPLDAKCTLIPDDTGVPIVGVQDVFPGSTRQCQSFDVAGVPNGHGASLTIEKAGFAPISLRGILDTVTAGGGGFQCDDFRLKKNSLITVSPPITFDANGGNGSFEVKANAGFMWNADEDQNAEDWVEVNKTVVNGDGTKNFRVKSLAEFPQIPLPRSGKIEIFEVRNGQLADFAFIQIQQK